MSIQSVAVSSTPYLRPSSPSTVWLAKVRGWQRLLVLIAGTGVITVLSSCLAIGYGHLHSVFTAASAVGLGWCEGMPCYRNLVPGRTRWTAQLALFNDSPTDSPAPYRPSLFPSSDKHWLGAIFLPLPPNTNLTASDIVQLYGTPCRVDIDFYGQWGRAIFHFPYLDAQLDTDQYRLNLATRVHYVTLHSPTSYPSRPESDPCDLEFPPARGTTVQRSWRGFASLLRYLDDQ